METQQFHFVIPAQAGIQSLKPALRSKDNQ
jgi:hypothetical protein